MESFRAVSSRVATRLRRTLSFREAITYLEILKTRVRLVVPEKSSAYPGTTCAYSLVNLGHPKNPTFMSNWTSPGHFT